MREIRLLAHLGAGVIYKTKDVELAILVNDEGQLGPLGAALIATRTLLHTPPKKILKQLIQFVSWQSGVNKRGGLVKLDERMIRTLIKYEAKFEGKAIILELISRRQSDVVYPHRGLKSGVFIDFYR